MGYCVTLEQDGAVTHLVIRRPERQNALDVETAEQFLACCIDLKRAKTVRAVVLSGEGGSFGVGGDLLALRDDAPQTARRIVEPMHKAVSLLASLDAPVIAKLRGNVAGGSLSLALGCDLALAAASTRFSFAYTRLAATPDLGGSWHLPRIVGLRRALQIALLNEPLTAAQALALGLVSSVVPDDTLDAEVDTLANRLAAGPTNAIGRTKRLLRQASSFDLESHMACELSYFVEGASSMDFREAVEAVLSKRSPNFQER